MPLDLLDQPPWQRETLTLLHFLWQGLAVAVVLMAVLWLFRVRRARACYALSVLALLVMAACPVVTFVVLERPRPPVVPRVSRAGPVMPSVASEGQLPISEAKPPQEVPQETLATSEYEPTGGLSVLAWRSAIGRFMRTHQSYLVAGWGAGVALLSVRLLLSVMGLYWVRRGRRPISAELGDCVARLCEHLKLRLTPMVMVSERIREALVVGFLRPMVLLPASWLVEMTPEVLEAVIAHELAHIRRFDLWVNVFQRVVETLLFYHPAVWWLSRRLRLEREMCCDELAVAATGRRGVYVDTLELVARRRFEPARPAFASTLGGGKMILLDRIRYIAGFAPGRNRARWWPVGAIALLVPAAVWLSSMSMAEPAPRAGKAQAQTEEQPSAPSPSDRKLDHLLKAARYLQAAGFEQEAKRCRELAGQESEALLLRIEALQAEIERLRCRPSSGYGSSIDQVAQSVQQVLVHVKIMEISRSKLRRLGFDWAAVSASDNSVVRGSGAWPGAAGKGYAEVGALTRPGAAASTGGTFRFDIMDGNEAFFRILDSLHQDNLARILSEPTFVTISGRPAFLRIGGEMPILAPQEQGTVAVKYKEYGTRLDAVPIVLSNGRLRMEVRMRVTELDWAKGIQFDGQPVPSFNTHEVDAGVEMRAGQTLVICGLAQNRTKAVTEEPPTADKTKQPEEEVELLVLITPELVDAEDAGGAVGLPNPASRAAARRSRRAAPPTPDYPVDRYEAPPNPYKAPVNSSNAAANAP